MGNRGIALASALLVGLLGASCAPSGDSAAESDDLVGGTMAAEGEFPSTLVILGGCTVAKVGPRHILTASHCVMNEGEHRLRAEYEPGQSIYFGRGVTLTPTTPPESAGYRRVTLARTHVPPVVFEERITNGWPRVLLESAPPDVALLELTQDSEAALADVPAAAVDLTPLALGAAVVIGGYGCEHGVKGAKDYSTVRLKRKSTKTLGVEAAIHPGSFVSGAETAQRYNLEKQYAMTPGQGLSAEEASLCPGDSGGPVYVDDGTASRIVGVNSYYSFADASIDPVRISKTNWHTRLDAESRFDVGSWLASLGAATIGAQPSERHSACAASASTGRLVCGAFLRHVASSGGEGAFGAATSVARFERDASGAWHWTQRFGARALVLDGATVRESTSEPAPCAAVDLDGAYCGASLGDPDARALYRCVGGAVAERTLCDHGCQANPAGVPDACASAVEIDPCTQATSGDGRYCGASLGRPGDTALYQCKSRTTFARVACASGCKVEPPGTPDRCL